MDAGAWVPLEREACAIAAARGHLEVLKWAREHQCPWDEDMCGCCSGWSTGGVEVVAGAPTTAHGMRTRVRTPLRPGSWRS